MIIVSGSSAEGAQRDHIGRYALTATPHRLIWNSRCRVTDMAVTHGRRGGEMGCSDADVKAPPPVARAQPPGPPLPSTTAKKAVTFDLCSALHILPVVLRSTNRIWQIRDQEG